MMKKLFFLATLLTLNTANVFGMLPSHSNRNRFEKMGYTLPTLEHNNSHSNRNHFETLLAQFNKTHVDDDLSHSQYNKTISEHTAKNEYATAAVMMIQWAKIFNKNVNHPDAQANIADFEKLHNEIQNNPGQKDLFSELASEASKTIADVRAAEQANNNNNSNNNANLQ